MVDLALHLGSKCRGTETDPYVVPVVSEAERHFGGMFHIVYSDNIKSNDVFKCRFLALQITNTSSALQKTKKGTVAT